VVSKLQLIPPGGEKPVLFEIDFALDSGQILAVIGPNAAGKSSLLKAILGLWGPQKGSVRLDGVDVADWDHDELGPHIGYVAQEADLFEATVAENIARLGIVDSEKAVQAARAVGMHEVILAFPKGYDTLLGDAGYALSGGQAQRIAIARALYGSPKLIVLDEPNAKLDETAELELMSTFRDLQKQGVTLVFTTHRPKLIAIADYLLVLRSGVQMEFGPVREILDRLKATGDEKTVNLNGESKPVKTKNIKVAGGVV
jgi:ATP-binding cassette, subfamily C, bacterial exporter for protease/lipase